MTRDNGDMYPTGYGPLFDGAYARKTDPETSHEAAEHLRGTGRLGHVQLLVLNIIKEHPGIIANEIWRLSGYSDPRTITPRLAELRRARLIFNLPIGNPNRTEKDPTTGRQQLCWFPEEP